jgi:hypothetical protein
LVELVLKGGDVLAVRLQANSVEHHYAVRTQRLGVAPYLAEHQVHHAANPPQRMYLRA